jgi:hypothetical protein
LKRLFDRGFKPFKIKLKAIPFFLLICLGVYAQNYELIEIEFSINPFIDGTLLIKDALYGF